MILGAFGLGYAVTTFLGGFAVDRWGARLVLTVAALLWRTIRQWAKRTPLAVVEGDQQTSRDADRVRAPGASAVQINTAKGCHLDAQMVAYALPP